MKKALFMFLVFCAFTAVVTAVDVQAIGPGGSYVGLSGINGYVKDLFPFNNIFYAMTQVLGYVAVCVMACFAVAGAVQFFQRKKLLSVDHEILFLGILYICVLALYVFFDKVMIINYRPYLFSGEQESSYPSSHTLLAVVVFGSAAIFAARKRNSFVKISSLILAVLTVVFRMVSGVHWFTDIAGGLLLGASLLFMFRGLLNLENNQ